MVQDLNLRTLLRPSALLLAAVLGGCGQMSGLSNLSLLGSTQDSADAAPDGQVQLATLTPEETPPVPSRRPGKRPRTPATQTAQAPATTASTTAAGDEAQPEKEESGISLASLGNISLFSGSSSGGGPDAVLIDQPPVQAYSLLAQRIKYCWLNPSSPRLPNHGFHAELPAGAEIKEAKMVVYEKDKDGRRGTTAFKVDITAESDGALVSARNVRLDKAMEAGFKADLARWSKGDERCKV
jgi:hypothetical protein